MEKHKIADEQCAICLKHKPGKKTDCEIYKNIISRKISSNDEYFIIPDRGCKYFVWKEGEHV